MGSKRASKKELEESTSIRVIYGEAVVSEWKFKSGIPDILFGRSS